MLHRLAVLTAAACLALPATTAGAGGTGSYTFDGGTKKERETVVAALRASSFDWSVVPGPIAIHIVDGEPSRSIPHEIWLDSDLLDAGESPGASCSTSTPTRWTTCCSTRPSARCF